VKFQSDAFLEKAHDLLRRAPAPPAQGFADEAGRAAYLAGFHAAQALIFERDDRILKTHRGVQGELARLVKADPRFDSDLRTFLGRAYNLKAVADYETGPGSKVTAAQASEAIAGALRFVATVESFVA
jgi:uncharacterized protein (UPF0332 family)